MFVYCLCYWSYCCYAETSSSAVQKRHSKVYGKYIAPSLYPILLALNLQSIGKFFKSRFKEISSLFIYISHTLLHRQTHRRVYPPGFIIMIFLNINFFIIYVNQKCDYNYFLQFFREADVQWKFFRYGYLEIKPLTICFIYRVSHETWQ